MNADCEPDLALKAELGRLVGPPVEAGSWRHVEDRARRLRRRRLGEGAVAAAVVVAVAGYGGYLLHTELWPQRAVVAITDSGPEAPKNLTGVKAELWVEIERVREQSESGALAWADIERTWTAIDPAYRGSTGANLALDTWLNWLNLVQNELTTTASAVDVTVYLTEEAGDIAAFQQKLAAMPDVKSVAYVSKEDALARLKQYFKDNPDVFSGLTGNPLPASLEITLQAGVSPRVFAAQLAGWTGIDQIECAVDYEGLLDLLRSLTPTTSTTT